MDSYSAVHDIFPYILPSITGLLTCISLAVLIVHARDRGLRIRVFGIICLFIALWSLLSISADLFDRQSLLPRIIRFLHPVSLMLIPLTIHLTHHVAQTSSRPWFIPLLYSLTSFVIVALGMGEQGMFHMRSIAPVLVLAGIAYNLKCFVSHLRSMVDKTRRINSLQIFSGIFLLQILLCLSFFRSSGMNTLEFAFIPVLIIAFGLFPPGDPHKNEDHIERKNLLYSLALALVLLPLISDMLFIFHHLKDLHLTEIFSWAPGRGFLTCISLVFSILLATIGYQKSETRLDALLFTVLCLGLALLNLRDVIYNGFGEHNAQQIVYINDLFLVIMIGITAHMVYVITKKAYSKKIPLFYGLGLVLAGIIFWEAVVGKGILSLIPMSRNGGGHVLFILFFLAVLIHCSVLILRIRAKHSNTHRRRQLMAVLIGIVLLILIGSGSLASSAGIMKYPFHDLTFIAFLFIAYGVFYHDIARINEYTRRRMLSGALRLLLIVVYLACFTGILYVLSDYPAEYVIFRLIPYGIPPALSFMSAAFLSLFVLGLGQNRTESLLFSLLCFCYALLNLDICLVGILADIELALFISRLDHFFLVLIMLGVNLHLIYRITQRSDKWWIVYSGYAIGAVMAPFTFTSYYFQGMYSYYWGFFAKKAILYDIMSTLWISAIFYSIYLLYQAFRNKDGSRRKTEKNILIAFVLIAALSVANTPAIYGYEIYPLGTFIFIALFFFAYGLFKFNVRMALQYVRSIIFWCGLILLLFIAGLMPKMIFSPKEEIVSLFSGILAAAVLYSPIRNGWDSILSLFIRRTTDVLNEKYHSLTEDLSRIRHLEKIHEMLGSWGFNVLGASSFVSLFRTGETRRYYGWKTRNSTDHPGLFGKERLLSFTDTPLKFGQDHWLVAISRKKQAIISHENIVRGIHEGTISEADAEMFQDAEIIIPAFSKGMLLAVFVLGRKYGGEVYSSFEIDLLENFSLMISPYIENAILMQGLEDEVQKRTSELNNALVESVTKEKQISERNKIITRQNQIFRTLLEMSTSIHEIDGLDALFEFTLNQLKTLFSDFRGGIILEGRRHNILEASAFAGIEEQEQKVILDNRHEIMNPDIDRILREEMEKAGHVVSMQDLRTVWNVFPMISRGNKITGYMVIKGREMDKLTKEIFAVFLGQLSAVTQNKLLMGQLEKMASTDGLTGLYNRSFLNRELGKVIDHAKRFQSICFAVMMIDMNGLKRINDTYGHEKGDNAIMHLAALLKKVCRRSDIVSRLGGDEFAVLMPSTNRVQAEILFRRITERAAGLQIECTDKNGQKHKIPLSISIGMASSDEFSPDEVMKIADTRMYSEKERFYAQSKGETPRRPSLRS